MVESVTNKAKLDLIIATGKRKTSTARVFLYTQKGDFILNGKNIDDVYPREKEKIMWLKPFHLVGIPHPGTSFSASIKVLGSGKSGQLGAIIHGISKALAKYSDEYALVLRKQGFLTRDSRMVERKKYFLRKARKRPQYSKR